MDRGFWFRWVQEWTAYLLWWFGRWLTMLIPSACPAASLGQLLGVPVGTSVAVAALFVSAAVGWEFWVWTRPALGSWLRGEQPPAGPPRELRAALAPDWKDAFAGMLAGPVLTGFVTGGLLTAARRWGCPAPPNEAFGLALLLGFWLGTFAWTYLGLARPTAQMRTWLFLSGAAALAGIALAVPALAWDPDHGWRTGARLAVLVTLAVPLLWSLLHLAVGFPALFPPDGPFGGPGGRGGRGGRWGWDGPSSGPSGGAGRPVPRDPYVPVRGGEEREPVPGEAAGVA